MLSADYIGARRMREIRSYGGDSANYQRPKSARHVKGAGNTPSSASVGSR